MPHQKIFKMWTGLWQKAFRPHFRYFHCFIVGGGGGGGVAPSTLPLNLPLSPLAFYCVRFREDCNYHDQQSGALFFWAEGVLSPTFTRKEGLIAGYNHHCLQSRAQSPQSVCQRLVTETKPLTKRLRTFGLKIPGANNYFLHFSVTDLLNLYR